MDNQSEAAGYSQGITVNVIVFRPPQCPVCGKRILVYAQDRAEGGPAIRYVKCKDDRCGWRGKMIEA